MPTDQSSAVSILFTVHPQDNPDWPLLNYLLNYHAEQHDFQVLVVEQGTEPHPERFLHNRIEHHFAFNPGRPNSGWGWNLGALASRSPILLFIDQTLISMAALSRAVKVCQTQAVAANLFSCTRILGREESQSLAERGESPSFDLDPSEPAPEFCSGGFGIRKELFVSLGGFDERIFSREFCLQRMSAKLNRSGGLLAGLDNSIGLKLPSLFRNGNADSPQPFSDDAMIRSSAPLFAFSCEVHRQLMGNRDKYSQKTVVP